MQAETLAKPRLSKKGHKKVWFARFAERAGSHFAKVAVARQGILMRYALTRWADMRPASYCIYMPAIDRSLSDCRWARQTAESSLRRQIWREACVRVNAFCFVCTCRRLIDLPL